MTNRFRPLWTLDPAVSFLNHGSYGACPRAILNLQAEFRARMERQPVQFLGRDLGALLDESRATLASFLSADPAGLVFVTNATTGVNTALRSIALRPGDELLVTDHAYNACRNALDAVAAAAGVEVAVAEVPFPIDCEDTVVEAILAKVSARTRWALIDHIQSATAIVFPIERIVRELGARGVETIVDGAHAPGMAPLELDTLGAAYYTGNGHKWLCAPKGAAFLYVRTDLRACTRPLVISHGANAPLMGRTRFQEEFAWTGTGDPTPFLCLGPSVAYMGALLPGGWPELMAANRAKALAGRRAICERLEIAEPVPEGMIGSIASIPLPPATADARTFILQPDPLHVALREGRAIEVPIFAWPGPPARVMRISAQLYNEPAEYERLADALCELLRHEPRLPG